MTRWTRESVLAKFRDQGDRVRGAESRMADAFGALAPIAVSAWRKADRKGTLQMVGLSAGYYDSELEAIADALNDVHAPAAPTPLPADPYEAHIIERLNVAGRGDLGSVGERTREGAEAHARLRLAHARQVAAALAESIAEIEAALAEAKPPAGPVG